MRSKITKLAAAAVIVIGVLLGFHVVGNPFASTLTFATVIQPILNANTAVLDIIVGPDEPGATVIHDMVMGSRIRRTASIAPDAVSILDLKDSRILTLSEQKKEAQYISMKGLPSIPNYLDNLKNVILKLQEIPQFTAENLGTRQFDGRTLVGFRATHPKLEVTIWADPGTGLPVRIEQNEGQLHVICKNVRFDEPMPEALFSMDVPPGYKLQQETTLDLAAGTEEAFIEGLRLLAETFNGGVFPDGVAVEDYLKQAPAVAKQIEDMKLSAEQQTEIGQKIQNYLLFTRLFRGEGKWYYRGKGVKLGDAATPIFWYRLKGAPTYRVIHGDLHVTDVAPENLPEPLAADDVPAVEAAYQQWSKPDFVGEQIDYWLVLPDGRAQVKAYLKLLKGPQGVTLMPVRLPYANAPLEAVLLGDSADPSAKDIIALPFHPTGEGAYDVELPIEKLTAGRTTIVFQWHVSLDDLKFEQGYYITTLHSLVPVVSYRLQVGVDPKSVFELTGKVEGLWTSAFSQGIVDKPSTEFGTCGLPIRKRP